MAVFARASVWRLACQQLRMSSDAAAKAVAPKYQQVVNFRDEEAKPELVSPLTGFPPRISDDRVARISIPARNAMQSGTDTQNTWTITWNTQERWENPLMGWASTADPLSNTKIEFHSKEDAMAFCEKNGWKFYVTEPAPKIHLKKSYGANFSWSKKTRVNTK